MWGSSKGVLGGVGSLKGLRGFRVFGSPLRVP